MRTFKWDKIQYKDDGKIFLLWRHERIFQEGIIKPGMNVLDVGGWGYLSLRLTQEKCNVTIFDLLTEDQYYKERVQNQNFYYGDICDCYQTSLFFNKMDVVTCFEVLEHVSSPEKAFKNIYDILKKDGVIAGTVPIKGFCHLEGDKCHFYSKEELQLYLGNCGFKAITIEPTSSINKNDLSKESLYFKAIK